MIYKLIIENFFSIADSQELIFEVPGNAPDLACFKPSCSDSNIRLPAVVGFFGPNASGKSTILRAVVSSVIMFALHSFDWKDQINFLFQPHRKKDWWGKPTKITIEFDSQLSNDAPPAIFRYKLHVAHQANDFTNKVISYESLSYAPKGKFRCLFERENQNFHFGQEFGISNTDNPRKESIRPDASVMSTLTKLNHPLSIHLCKLIGTWQTNNIGVNKIQKNVNQWLSIYANDKTCLARLNRELRRFDVGLESMSIEQGNQGSLFAKFQHVGLDGDIDFAEESSGTKRFIETFPLLHYVLETGSVAIIDEIDTDLHPLLLPELFRWFNDEKRNPHGAQLFFTAHNPALLDDLEKEQIFFTEKPMGQPSYVYGARDIKGLRREPSLMKKYLAGELGAIPHVG
jgi:hypothetical protein